MSDLATFLSKLLRRFESAINAEFMDAEERSRFQHYSIFFLLGLPTMALFGATNLLAGDLLLTLAILTAAAALTYGWFGLRRASSGRRVYRWNTVVYTTLLLYMLMLGGDEGSKSLWMFTVPMFTVFLLGKLEGFAWSATILGLSILGFLLAEHHPSLHHYSSEFELRFVLVYLMILAISCWFEHLRQTYRAGLENQNQLLEAEQVSLRAMILQLQQAEQDKAETIRQLEMALDEVATLRGLLPMCASCRKIRHDDGFWKNLEDYLEDHASVRFTHGLCPECIQTLYPEMYPPKT